MKYVTLAAVAIALIAAPVAGQNAASTPPPSAKAGFDQAIYCAALKTFFSAIDAQSTNPDPAIQNRLERSAERWLQYAEQLPQQNRQRVLERFSVLSKALNAELVANMSQPEDFAEKVTTDLETCNAAARATFDT